MQRKTRVIRFASTRQHKDLTQLCTLTSRIEYPKKAKNKLAKNRKKDLLKLSIILICKLTAATVRWLKFAHVAAAARWRTAGAFFAVTRVVPSPLRNTKISLVYSQLNGSWYLNWSTPLVGSSVTWRGPFAMLDSEPHMHDNFTATGAARSIKDGTITHLFDSQLDKRPHSVFLKKPSKFIWLRSLFFYRTTNGW